MAGFVFRLQGFLTVKEKIEDQKKAEYGKSMAKLNEEIRKLENLKTAFSNTVANMKKALREKIDPRSMRMYNGYIDNLKRKIKSQQYAVEMAEKEVDRKRAELVSAMKERKMLETLKEHDKETYLKEQLRKEQKVTDEIVSYKYSTR